MRATASHAAFQSRFPFNEYWPRYQSFMRLPVYATGCDMMVVTPDGRCASFCIFWPDAVNKVALFEPVGTHPDFQRRGLGKALLSECLRRLQAEGMEHAIVGTNSGNLAAERLYESVGFKLTNRILLYTKSL
jgi:ribosomal protein S18 acetylase RimI-like enzyme